MPETPVPQWTPTARELDDLDVIVKGSLGPDVTGFADPDAPGSLPLTLTVAASEVTAMQEAGHVDLLDPEGVPLGRLTIASTYPAAEAEVGLVGTVERLAHNEFGPFRRLHLGPDDLHAGHPKESLLAVPVDRPLTFDDVAKLSAAATTEELTPLLIALVGQGAPDRMSGAGLVRATLAAAELVEPRAVVVAVSLADHGPAHNAALRRRLADTYADHTAELDAEAGSWPKPVAEVVRLERPPRDEQGVVVFFTGLSGSGKSTLARALVDQILEHGERTVTSLDGDVVRHHLSKGLGFSREDRETNILRIGFVAAEIARHGGVAICSPIAPFDATRQEVRRMVEAAGGGFVLIHVATPLEECERRDRKGLYAKARRGEIPDFTGISSPYEEPRDALKIDTTNRDIAECLQELTQALAADGWFHA